MEKVKEKAERRRSAGQGEGVVSAGRKASAKRWPTPSPYPLPQGEVEATAARTPVGPCVSRAAWVSYGPSGRVARAGKSARDRLLSESAFQP